MVSVFKLIFSSILSLLTIFDSIVGFPATSTFLKINRAPVVYESGDDMYTVMWTTNVKSTGTVSYTYDGEEYVCTDNVGGNIRISDTIHSVRVPKEHLDNNTYTVSSQFVAYKGGYTAIKGKTVSYGPIQFRGYDGQDEIRALVLSDIHGDMTYVRPAVASFEEKPDFIILNGDIANQMVTKEEFLDILDFTAELSKGEIPVVYARGNHEPRGEYASEFMKYFKTETGNLWYTFNYGPVWSVVLDCGEDKADDHKEYSGLVDFSTYIAEETKWLYELEPDTSESTIYRLCITHSTVIDNEYGNNWVPALEALGVDAAIFGHLHRLDLNFKPGSAPFNKYVTGGKTSNGFIATMITFSDGTMSFVSKDQDGNVCGEATQNVRPVMR